MKVAVKVMVDVEVKDEMNEGVEHKVLDAVEHAIISALWDARGKGWDHDMGDRISILPDYASADLVERR